MAKRDRYLEHLANVPLFADCSRQELALLHEAPRNATVTATGQLETIVVQSQEFGSLLREAPELSRKVMAGMARRLQHLDTSRLV